jgi:hypothetical protein
MCLGDPGRSSNRLHQRVAFLDRLILRVGWCAAIVRLELREARRDERQALPAGDLRERLAIYLPEQPACRGRLRDRNVSESWSDDASGQRPGPGRCTVRGRPNRDAGVRAGAVVQRCIGKQRTAAEFSDDSAARIGSRLMLNSAL